MCVGTKLEGVNEKEQYICLNHVLIIYLLKLQLNVLLGLKGELASMATRLKTLRNTVEITLLYVFKH